MSRIKRAVLAVLLMFMIVGVAGCNADYNQLLQKTKIPEEPLIRVQIQFTDQKQTICYVKSLGLEEKGQIYTGGASLNYMYDREGKIIGSFNYQRVVYMKILTDEESTD
ncbi:MAG: hypothetical protein CVU90_12795 [Firmicutes bacterium HGW-Firmicutes-15]|nr:MAG: hypothetical protein CVU90_12795 [Firmicutes bacterium HGW-Firmicutes-15]